MTIVFSYFFKRDIEYFPAYLMAGNVLFAFMRESTTLSMSSVINNAMLLKKVSVPKYIFTLATVTSSFVNLLFALGAFLLVLLIVQVPLSLYMFLIIIPIVELFIFCIGLGLFLSQITVFFRDVKNIWSVVTLAWMYMTPIFYPIESLDPRLARIIMHFNPMYIYITIFRDLAVYSRMSDINILLQGASYSFIMLVIGSWFFRKNQGKFILYI